MRRWYISVILLWIVLSYAIIQRWPEVRVLVPFAPVAFVLPLVWIRSFDGRIVATAVISVLVSALAGFGQLAAVYFIVATAASLLVRSLPVPISVRILILVMTMSSLEVLIGSTQASYDTFFLAIFSAQTLVGFLVVRAIVNTKAFDYKTQHKEEGALQ